MHATYDAQFYRDLAATAGPSAARVWPLVLELAPIASAVDVGCGDGGWLAALMAQGVADVLGLEGDWVAEAQLRIPPARFRRADLRRPIVLDRRFDLACSLEVAEHLPPERADGFVADLARLAPLVLFSAALPGQGGPDHLNEQWPAYWAARFAANGFRAVDCLRLRLWADEQVAWWYRQNLLLFSHADALVRWPRLAVAADAAPPAPLHLVHPACHDQLRRRANPRFGRWLKMAPDVLRRSARPR
jgi:SAM-dependent methyltransferase